MSCSPEPTDRCCWKSTRSKWRAPSTPGGRAELTSCLFALDWEPANLGTPTTAVKALLLVGDAAAADPLLNTLANRADGASAHCEVMSARDLAEFRDAMSRKDIEWSAVVVGARPGGRRGTDGYQQLDLALSRTLLVANLVKTLTQIGARNSPRLWIVTRGAQQLDAGDRVTLAQAQLRGLHGR